MKIRNSARAVLMNENNEFLMMKFVQNRIVGDKAWWVFPGGGKETNESYEEACIREIFEETGITLSSHEAKLVWTREIVLNGKDGDILSHEQYYLFNVNKFKINFKNFTDNEKKTFCEYKWWRLNELSNYSGNDISIDNLYDLLSEIVDGNLQENKIIN